MQRIAALCTIFLLAFFATKAQTDFSGGWTFNNQQSISGTLYSNGSPKQIVIRQKDKTMFMQKVSTNADGNDYTTVDTLSFDGKPFVSTTLSKRYKETTLQWNNTKDGFTTTGNAFNPADKTKVDIRTTDRWSIENDQLVLVRKVENFTNGEVWKSKATYDKQ
jgi:hypothetical protein